MAITSKKINGYWTVDHKCSICGEDCFKTITDAKEHYDYDWNEDLVPTGKIDYTFFYEETPFCPYCGTEMIAKE